MAHNDQDTKHKNQSTLKAAGCSSTKDSKMPRMGYNKGLFIWR